MSIASKGTVYTIGYSGFPDVDKFISKLKEYGINVLIDVRSTPYSSYFSQYDKENLAAALKKAGIYYRNYAREFGARQEDRKFYLNGVLNFERFTSSEQFAEGVRKVDAAIEAGYQPALMCAEKNPTDCHRAIMIGKKLDEEWFNVIHLMPGNTVKTQEDIGRELLAIYFPNNGQIDIFDLRTEEELIQDAYAKQNQKIGFKEFDLFR